MKITGITTIPILCVLFSFFVSEESEARTTGVVQTEHTAQHEFNFRTLSPPDGLSFGGVNDIVRDGDGFVWVLLSNSIYRFDGYEYKPYYSHFRDKGIYSRLLFHDLAIDSRGRLYVSCAQGLFGYDPSTDSFERLLDRAYYMFVDAHDNLWTSPSNMLGIVRGSDSLEVKMFNGNPIVSTYTVETNTDDNLLVASGGRILSYDYSSDLFSLFYTFPPGHTILKMQRSGEKLWVLLPRQGLAVIDIPSQTMDTVFDFPLQYEGLEMDLRDMLLDKSGNIWIGTQQGLWFFDPLTMERQLYRHVGTDIFSLPNNSIRVITDDQDGNIWIGTYSGKLCMVDLTERKSFITSVQQPSGLNHNTVSAFAEDDRSLWIGTEGGGVNRMDKHTGRFDYIIPRIPGSGMSYPGNHIKSLVRDRSNKLWIATFQSGLTSYDIRSEEFHYFNTQSPAERRLLGNDLRKILPEGDLGLWIAYQDPVHAVSFLPFDNRPIAHFSFKIGGLTRFNMDICRSGDYLWIITQQTLYRLNVTDGSMVDVSSERIEFINAQSLCADTGDNVWIGTVNGIVLRYDPVADEFTTITGLDRYNITTIYSMCFDDRGDLWMGTDNGLLRYTPGNGKFSRFDYTDGTQGNMYYPLSSMSASSGRLVFGGTSGFTIVDPHAVSHKDHTPKTIISGFTINNTPAIPRYGNSAPESYHGREIVLSYKETGFGFRLASDNFSAPSKTRFRYMLEGYDHASVTTDAGSRTVVYSNVPAGTYRFEVAASTDGEAWGEPVLVTVIRRPAPWNSRAAWALYCAILLTVAGTIIYYRLEKGRLAMQVYLDGLEKQKQEELHQSQLRFFTNISHDFRTPLSLILGAVDNLGNRGEDNKYYHIVGSNSRRLLGLVNELMDFRTVENGMMRLKVQSVEVNRLIKDISADFHDFACEKSIDFRIECDESLSALVPIDRTVVEKIVMNLLNNAFKYTPRGGTITISTHAPGHDFRSRYDNWHRIAAGEDGVQRFTIAVSDTGVGISKESISKVFERFYKVNTTGVDLHLGTGIGLALVKSLVLLHHGVIMIFSERDRGTDMAVEFPFKNTAYTPEELFTASDGIDSKEVRDDRVDPAKSAAESMLMRTRKRILIVEDNDELRMLVSDFLSADYETVQAADGEIASEWLETGDADLIIADIMMPGKDGVTLCREVKENVASSHIPFIMLTAKTDIASKLEGTGSGADLYFEKPVDLNLLALSIGNIFSRQNKLREHYSKNYFVESSELSQNEHDNAFLKKLIDTIDRNLIEPVIDVNFIASELSMSRSKLYSKVKTLTGKSIVEFILNYRLRKAARLIIEEDLSMRQVMERVGIRSQPYFTEAFKKEFDQTPLAFAKSHKVPLK